MPAKPSEMLAPQMGAFHRRPAASAHSRQHARGSRRRYQPNGSAPAASERLKAHALPPPHMPARSRLTNALYSPDLRLARAAATRAWTAARRPPGRRWPPAAVLAACGTLWRRQDLGCKCAEACGQGGLEPYSWPAVVHPQHGFRLPRSFRSKALQRATSPRGAATPPRPRSRAPPGPGCCCLPPPAAA